MVRVGFLAFNVAALVAIGIVHLVVTWLLDRATWLPALDTNTETSWPSAYQVALWVVVATVAFRRLVTDDSRRRQLGWLACTWMALFVAANETQDMWIDLTVGQSQIRGRSWVMLAPLWVPIVLGAGWVVWMDIRHSRWLRRLAGLVAILALSAVTPQILLLPELGLNYGQEAAGYWLGWIEEGCELMVAALLAVILGTQPSGGQDDRSLVASVGISVGLVLTGLSVVAIALLPMTHMIRGTGQGDRGPGLYHGPLSEVSQRIEARDAWLSAIDVWAYTKNDAQGTVFLRLTSPGSSQPLRESQAVVTHRPWSHERVRFHFEPIPGSAGRTYDVTVGAFPESQDVFVGLAQHDPHAGSVAMFSGQPDAWGNDLALRTYWAAGGPRFLWHTLTTLVQDPGRAVLVVAVLTAYAIWISAVLVGCGRNSK